MSTKCLTRRGLLAMAQRSSAPITFVQIVSQFCGGDSNFCGQLQSVSVGVLVNPRVSVADRSIRGLSSDAEARMDGRRHRVSETCWPHLPRVVGRVETCDETLRSHLDCG
jgi:hypothetical protein